MRTELRPPASRPAVCSVALAPPALAAVALLALSPVPTGAQTLSGGTAGAHAVAFGAAVAVAEGEILVGRPESAALLPMPPTALGGVHVFRRSGDGWSETQTLTADDVAPADGFGAALSMAGDLLAVGAPGSADGRGVVYLYERQAGGQPWVLAARLSSASGAAADSLGAAVAAADGLVVAGAPGAGERGAAVVFRRAGDGVWAEESRLEPSSGESGDRFGAAVAARGTRLLVGAPGPGPGLSLVAAPVRPRAGSAWLFVHEAGGWREEARLSVAGEPTGALGATVVLSDDELFVSAPGAARGTGAVHRFRQREGEGWGHAGSLRPPDAEPPLLFGAALALDAREILVGAPLAGGFAGAVYVYRRQPAGEWLAAGRLTTGASGGFGNLIGAALAARGGVAVAGAPAAEFFEGVGYLFERDEAGGWHEAGRVVGDAPELAGVGGEVRCEGGVAGVFGCQGVDLLAFLPLHALGGQRGVWVNDVWGWTDPETGREYALVGRVNGVAFVDVSDPASPVYMGELPATEGSVPNLWRDVKVYAGHAFIVADNAGAHGVQVFDLTGLRDVESAPATLAEAARYTGIHSAHNIAINEETGFAYVVGASGGGETCGGGLHMVDVRDPRNPIFAGCFADPTTGNAGTGYTHDAQCVVYRGPDVEHRGKEICFGANETALSIADVTDKENPVALAAATYPNVVYAHQGWLSEDHRYFYLDDELDEVTGVVDRTRTLVWDVRDLDDPVLATEHRGTTGATDHNLYVRGRYMYQANYVSGLRILEIADPVRPVEVGYFDTVPHGQDAPGFAGAWSAYPFFPSGTILVTSMREGLFLLRQVEGKPTS